MKIEELPEKAEPTLSGWNCKECGTAIVNVRVAHPIWDGPFPMSGSGKCEYEQVPYCPQCEEKPSFHGAPIRRLWAW